MSCSRWLHLAFLSALLVLRTYAALCAPTNGYQIMCPAATSGHTSGHQRAVPTTQPLSLHPVMHITANQAHQNSNGRPYRRFGKGDERNMLARVVDHRSNAGMGAERGCDEGSECVLALVDWTRGVRSEGGTWIGCWEYRPSSTFRLLGIRWGCLRAMITKVSCFVRYKFGDVSAEDGGEPLPKSWAAFVRTASASLWNKGM